MTIKVTIPNTSSDSLTFGSANTPTAAQVVGIDSGSSNGQLAFNTTASGTSTERMRINTSGNVGIGTSPSAWGTGFKAIQFAGGASFQGDSAGLNIPHNAYYDGTNWKYISSGVATLYSQGNGSNVFYSTASGTANANIAWTANVTINTSGDLLLSKSGSLNLNVLNTFSSGSPGYQRLPSGIIIQYGSVVFNATSGTVTYPVAFVNTVWPIISNGESTVSSATFGTTSTSNTGFTIQASQSTLQRVNWFAAGY